MEDKFSTFKGSELSHFGSGSVQLDSSILFKNNPSSVIFNIDDVVVLKLMVLWLLLAYFIAVKYVFDLFFISFQQALQSIKNHLRQDLLNNLDTVLAQEQKQHVKQWATPECQQMFKEFVSKGGIL